MNHSWGSMTQQELQKKFLNEIEKEYDICLPKKVNVMGKKIGIVYSTSDHFGDLETNFGIYSHYEHQILIDIGDWLTADNTRARFCELENIKATIRHEIIHAFFASCGLMLQCEYANNEELVDWIANQLPAMFKTVPRVVLE